MKKNNTVEKSVLKAEKLSKALKENTEKTLRDLVNETITNLILEDEEMPEEDNENEYEVEDVDVEDNSKEEDETEVDDTEKVDDTDDMEDSNEGDDEWSDFEEFKTDDNDYDITDQDENGVEILRKMYDMLEDGDELIVTKNGDNLEISNEETGEEEVINMSDESVELPGEESEEEFEVEFDDEPENEFEVDIDDSDNEGDEIEIDVHDEDEDSDEEYEFEVDDEDDLEEGMNEEDDVLTEENLGYTDNYQKKTAMTTPSNKEVANPKDTYSMDDVPEGDGKRWAGKGNSNPYDCKTTCCENEDMMSEEPIEEGANVGGAVQQRSSSKSKIPAGRKNNVPKGTRHASFGAEYNEIVEAYEKMKKENETLKENVKATKKSLMEAAILNVNLGKIVNLLVNETTTRDEKKSILSRFNEVKTINEGNTLYNTIKRELNESKKNHVAIDRAVVVENKQNMLNETTLYQDRSKNPSLSLMDRMDNLYKR